MCAHKREFIVIYRFTFSYIQMLRIIFYPYNVYVGGKKYHKLGGLDDMEKEFLTVCSLANLLEMSEQTTYKLARNG